MNNDSQNVSDLQLDPKNPRTISKHDFNALKASMKRWGDLSGVVKNLETGVLVGGHQRVQAFNQLGKPPIEIIERLDQPNSVGTVARGYVLLGDEKYTYREVRWSEPEQHAANIAANRISGEFQIDMLAELTYELSQIDPDLVEATGQTQQEIDRLLDLVGAKGEKNEDDAPAVDETNPPKSELGKVYQLGRHRLMCGDATKIEDVNKLMDGKQADMVWTDPPYNVAYNADHEDNKALRRRQDDLQVMNDSFATSEEFYEFLLVSFTNLEIVTKAGSPIYICHADAEGLNFRKAMIDAGWLLKQCIIWNKSTMVMGRQDYHWKHEPILYGWKEGAAHYFVNDRTQTTVWEFDKPSASNEHPTMKPLALVKNAIANSSRREAIVIDTFGGSGSTLMAADELDRTCYTMELDPKYCDVIRKRYAKSQGHEADWDTFTPVAGTEPVVPPAPAEPRKLEDIKIA